MIPFYWKSPAGNFGDDLNDWLWDDLLPGFRDWDRRYWLIGVGTVLNSQLLPDPQSYLVIGGGVGIGTTPTPGAGWDLRCVRGPRTAQALGLPITHGIIDPAALTSRLPAFAAIKKTGRTVFIPHCHSDVRADYNWPRICAEADMTYLSPRGEAKDVIATIAGAERVISESMHGAIIADAFRVPWCPVSLVHNFNDFKWRDWGESLELSFEIEPLPRPLQYMRDKLRPLRRKKRPMPSGSTPAKDSAAISAGDSVSGTRRMIRKAAHGFQTALTAQKLTNLATRDFHLSKSDVLGARLDRLEEILRQVAEDYK